MKLTDTQKYFVRKMICEGFFSRALGNTQAQQGVAGRPSGGAVLTTELLERIAALSSEDVDSYITLYKAETSIRIGRQIETYQKQIDALTEERKAVTV